MNSTLIKRLDDIYQYVIHHKQSDFYRKLYTETRAAPSIETISDWQLLPILTRDFLQQTPFLDRLFIPYMDVPYFKATSGTGGRGVLVVPRSDKASSGSVVANRCVLQFAPPPISKRKSSITDKEINVIDGDLADLEGSVILAAQAGVDCVSGLLFAIEACIPALEKYGLTEQINSLQITGERPTTQQLERFKTIFPNASIRIFYIATEVGGLMGIANITNINEAPAYTPYISQHCEFYWEIINEEGQICTKDGDEGEAVVTQLQYEDSPLPILRYRTGDRFQIKKNKSVATYLSLGRMQLDRIKVPGGLLQLTEVGRALTNFHPTLTDDFELHFFRPTDTMTQYKICIHIRTQNARQLTDALIKELSEKLAQGIRIAPHFTIADGVKNNIFAPLELTIVQNFDQPHKKRVRFFEH